MSYQDGLTGRYLEDRFLGRCLAVHVKGSYLSYNAALAVVRKNQPKQKSDFLKRLESAISELLNARVAAYTAARSTFDELHGGDLFFEFAEHPGLVVVTADITCNSKKDCGKAHFVFGVADLENESMTAERVAREMRSQLLRRVAA